MVAQASFLYTLFKSIILCSILGLFVSCSSESNSDDIINSDDLEDVIDQDSISENVKYANIDFKNWKVTLPIDADGNGSPDEYLPQTLIDLKYQTLEAVKPYMYDDESDASIVFYTIPNTSTANSKYSRTELRELIQPSNSKVNWTLETGGVLSGTLKVEEMSKNNDSYSEVYHKVIVMQIHGIISQKDMESHGFSSNNGPPLLKMYWKDGEIWAHKKSLKDESTSGDDLLDVSSDTWTDVKHNLGYVGFDSFHLKIEASSGKLVITLNNDVTQVYEDESLAKWPFENYFKAGNYLNSTAENAYSKIKYYDLFVAH